MYFPAAKKDTYRRMLNSMGRSVTLKIYGGSNYTVKAHVTAYESSDLVPDGPIRVGDIRLIILAEDLPESIGQLDQRSKVEIEGRNYAIMNWDPFSRAVGETSLAIEAAVRGG